MAPGVPIGDGQFPTQFGERLTCPMCGEAHTFRTPVTVIGAHYRIPTQNGEGRRAAGVTRSWVGVGGSGG